MLDCHHCQLGKNMRTCCRHRHDPAQWCLSVSKLGLLSNNIASQQRFDPPDLPLTNALMSVMLPQMDTSGRALVPNSSTSTILSTLQGSYLVQRHCSPRHFQASSHHNTPPPAQSAAHSVPVRRSAATNGIPCSTPCGERSQQAQR